MADYIFRLDINVYDPQALYQAAIKSCHADGMSGAEIDDLLIPGGEVQIHNCLAMILDPGSLDGCSIYGHEVEQCPEYVFYDTEGDGL